MPIVPANIPQPQQNRTEVGVRSLNQSSQPAALKKGGGKARRTKKKDGSDTGGTDRVSREDANLLIEEVGEEPRRQQRQQGGYAELEPVAGHSATLVPWAGRAFRIDEAGREAAPHYSDVEQGNLQDAWLLATFAAVAEAQPAALLQRIKMRPKGDFTIRLGARTHRVTPEFPGEGYAGPEPGGHADTLWVALLEKAFALDSACSYGELETGNPARALPLLVEGKSRRKRVRIYEESRAQVERLRQHRRAGRPIVAVTRTGKLSAPWVADHAYAVVDVTPDGNIKAYNPWGTRRGTRPLESVVHTAPWSEARQAFEFLYVGGFD